MTAVLAEAAARRERGEPFVLATVVWRRGPSSSRAGGKALISVAGSVSGWLGGACAEPTVVREALAALQDGRPRLLFLGPADELGTRADVVRVPMACESEGAMEVFLEPVMPAPRLVAIGGSPAAGTLVRLADALGWHAWLDDPPGLAAAGIRAADFVIVATQGHYDEEALEAALATPAAYVGLVASRKRADAVRAHLRDRGVPEEALTRLHAPAGLDLGPVEPDEIAVAILAELVARRAAGGPAQVEVAELEEATDPVCGMTVAVAAARHTLEHGGSTYYFCAAGCRSRFAADPAAYLFD